MIRRAMVLILIATIACRGESQQAQKVDQKQLSAMVDSLMPVIAARAGLPFKSTPRSEVRSRDQIHAYLLAKLQQELPPARLEGLAASYRLLGMLPDTLDIKQLFLDLYTEQIAGFYDPDSTTFYAVAGGDRTELRLVIAHELVHALQHQYVPLDSIMHDGHDSDRLAASQAVFEGQATLTSLMAMMPDQQLLTDDGFWETFKEQLHTQQASAGVFSRAPMVIREDLTFPYVQGSEFVRWFERHHPGEQPFGANLPRSTEQVLHPDRYDARDEPVTVRFIGDTTGLLHEDTFGEFEIALLRSALRHDDRVSTDQALGWGGDRWRVYRTPDGPALVWVTVWDAPRFAQRFRSQVADPLEARPRAGYRTAVATLDVAGKVAIRIVIAPGSWTGWRALPEAVAIP